MKTSRARNKRANTSILNSRKQQQVFPAQQESTGLMAGHASQRPTGRRIAASRGQQQSSSKIAKLNNMFALSIRRSRTPIRPDLTTTISLSILSVVIVVALAQAVAHAATNQRAHRQSLPIHRRSLFDDDESAGGDDDSIASYSVAPLASSEQLALSGGAGGEKPRLIPLVAADSGYSENSSVNVLCTVSQGHHETLQFDWFKDGQLLAATTPTQAPTSALGSNQDYRDNELQAAEGKMFASVQQSGALVPFVGPQIEKHGDHSLLRISRVQSYHSGRYTCAAKNQYGQDSSSVNLIVNVKLQWIKEPPKEIVVSLNQELKVDCLAQGEPKPSMRWEKLDSFQAQGSGTATGPAGPMQQQQKSAGSKQRQQGGGGGGTMLMHHHSNAGHLASISSGSEYIDSLTTSSASSASASSPSGARNQLASRSSSSPATGGGGGLLVSSSRYLSIQRVRESDSGIYECIASNSHDNDLRKLVNVQVRGPPKILPIATADSYPEGSSINLICTVSGGQRRGLTLSWTLNGADISDHGGSKHSDLFDNVAINTDDADISILKIKNATLKNSGQYTCTAKNPLGQDSTSVKIVINVDMKWSKVPNDQIEVGIGKEVVLECDAIGSPQPIVEWIKHSSDPSDRSNGTHTLVKSNVFKISRAQHRDSGLYECMARNGVNDNLRKFVQVKVRGYPNVGILQGYQRATS